MPSDRVRLPRVTTLAAAAAAGLGQPQVAWRVRVGDWSRLAPAVYCTSPPHTVADLIRAAAHHAAPHGMVTGAAALTIHRFDHIQPFERATVLVPYAEGIRSAPLIQVRRAVHLPEAVIIDGLAAAPVSRAVVDHAMTLLWLDDVRALVARAVQHHGCTIESLRDELPHIARRGSGKLRRALDEIGAGARSAPEARAGRVLTEAGCTGFEQNVELRVSGARFVGDFLWRTLRAVLEIDSVEFHYDKALFDATLDRDASLKAAGYDVLHVTPRMISRTPELLVARVRRWLLARSRDLGVAMPWTHPG